jgi:hypothetical protein
VIPFLGAGASFGSRNPSKTTWRTAEQGAWKMAYLPTASELADFFAGESSFPKDEKRELTTVSQYYSAVIGRLALHEELHQIFTHLQEPGPLHAYLAASAAHAPLLIVTTNYDDLIERAFIAAGQPYDTVIHLTSATSGGEVLWCPHGDIPREKLAKELDIELSKVSVIYKIHGSIDRSPKPEEGQYVITEDDYIDFLTRMTKSAAIPNIFAEPFQTRPFLFLGYGLYDWNLRVVLNRIELRRPGDIVSWAIETRPKPLEKTLWEKRGVMVFDGITLEEFVEKLQAPAEGKAAVNP